MGTGSSPGVESGRGVVLTTHLLLTTRSRMSGAIPLLPLWAFGACYRAKFLLLTIVGFLRIMYRVIVFQNRLLSKVK
jgi:hypothetical protein